MEDTINHAEAVTTVLSSHAHAFGGFPFHFGTVVVLFVLVAFAVYVAHRARRIGLTYYANYATVVTMSFFSVAILLTLIDELYPFGFLIYHGDHLLPIIGVSSFIVLHFANRRREPMLKKIDQERKKVK